MTSGEPADRGLFRITTARPVAVAMFFVTLITFGWESLQRLPTNLLPDISYPRVTVRAEYPGAAPEDVEERVAKRLHEALAVLGGLENISSVSRAGSVDVTLEFVWGTPLGFAIQDIRERLDRTILPLEVGTPIILRYDPTLDPVLSLGITGGKHLVELRQLAEDRLAPAVSTVEGVAAVRVRGGLQDEIQVRLKRDRLASRGLTADDVAARLAAENVNMASGTVLEGDTEYLVRILNEYRDPDEIGRTILFRDGASLVRLSDVGTVHRTNKERDVITRIDGRESVELQIFKEADANIVDLAAAVRDRVLGSAAQAAWVARLRSGEIEDPEQVLRRLQADTLADAELAAAVAQLQASRGWGGGAGRGQDGDDSDPDDDDEDEDDSDAGAQPASGFGCVETPRADTPDPQEDPLIERAEQRLEEIDAARADLLAKEEAFDYLAADLPSDVSVHLLSDQSRFIQSALEEVQQSGLFGAALAVVVLFLFLRRLGTTLIIAVAIPVSVLVTFVPLHLTDTTLNVMSLGGLALGIGMVVDNAIVVLESIARYRELGHGKADAAVLGVREVAGAATASTLTTVAVFAPIVFVEGIAGQVFRDQALTVVASLMVSLVVALLLIPMLASRGRDVPEQAGTQPLAARLRAAGRMALDTWSRFARLFLARPSRWPGFWRPTWRPLRVPGRTGLAALASRLIAPLVNLVQLALLLPVWMLQVAIQLLQWTVEILVGRAVLIALALAFWAVAGALWLAAVVFRLVMWIPGLVFGRVYDLAVRAYPPFIRGIVTSPGRSTLTLVVAALLMAWTLTTAGKLGSELLPEVHQGQLVGRLTLKVGTPLEETDLVARLAERQLRRHPDVEWVAVTVGVPRDEVNDPDEGEHTARLDIGLLPNDDMQAAEDRVMTDLRAQLGERPELRDVRFERPALFTVRAPLSVEIKGDQLAALGLAAREVEAAMRSIPGLRDVRSSVQPGSPEVMISFDRDLISRYGQDTDQLAQRIRDLVQGRVATRFTEDEHKIDIRVQMDKAELQSLDDLARLPIDPAGASSEPLSSLADIRVREGPREIRRVWGRRAAVVSAGLSGFDIGSATEQIQQRLVDIERRSDLVIEMSGQAREMEGALDQMTTALLLAVFLVYVVMASIFESLLQPLIIMVTVPLALFGAVAALWLLEIPLSVVVFIGAIILAGIVVNNAIVFIDACNRRRRLDGFPLEQAVTAACEQRLRPILMTTMTTVLGLLPLTGWLPLTAGEGTELRAPMAVTVVAGLSMATLLTLIVIPTVYTLVERALEQRAGTAPGA